MYRKFAACGSFGWGGTTISPVRLGTVVPPIGVIGGRGGDAGPKHRHRRRLLGQGRHQSLEEWRDLSLGDQSLRKLVEIGLGWELEVVEKVGDLLERKS